MNCVGSNLGAGLTYDDGEHDIYVNVSSDTGNQTGYGSDDGIYTPATVVTAGTATTVTGTGTPQDPYVINTAPNVGDTAIQAGDGITVDGAGVTDDPFVISTAPSYAVSRLTGTVTLTETGRRPAPITLAATSSYLSGGDVVDNGDGTVTIQRPGTYYLSVTPRFRAGSNGPGIVYIYLMAGGSSRAWGGLTAPDTTSYFSLGYTVGATYSTTVPAVVQLDGQRSTNVHTAMLDAADVTITRLGPAFDATQAAHLAPLPEPDAADL